MKRIKYSKEPVLHVHRYIVLVYHKLTMCKYKYCENLKAVQKVKNKAKPGTIIEVYKAEHNFKEAFET